MTITNDVDLEYENGFAVSCNVFPTISLSNEQIVHPFFKLLHVSESLAQVPGRFMFNETKL